MIILTNRFKKELGKIVGFIKKDSKTKALKFRDDLLSKIDQIPNYPQIYRKSLTTDDEDVKDLIFKGFVVVFRIKNDDIYILGIYKHNLWKN
ncbi:type II toxin-antitoxin system RelE/ParE family toxin [Campylobacter ureolyticus]|uniref:Toxin-antitoxin system, toxin component, RelE/ParE family n=1 Tax=Campylobacter ureolyticus TaxID=827 RepID=A0AAE7JPX8_9BACT|nr:type II toxin-antitoxin system RelE/ParE family toxin [Campylobacter ureolyticus]MCR8684407.1 type II toxin-antitoxin system RelE/ParE family toxin [Campylobacter ureolyticus]QKF84806.1 toxin-antitoxin system, toxin component, RelE/ParE family [Campylobacter ureolyticus]QQY35029.1 type II toxin-antitoxin system RelE/ParE family toxin [Campylobacter ureolyticus]SUX21104.1 plasmid stabilization system protein [Campylobacter ureolyticus]